MSLHVAAQGGEKARDFHMRLADLPEFIPLLARAAVAAGIDGLFIEVHPDPTRALCDAASQMCISDVTEFLKPLIDIHNVEVRYRS